MGSRNLIERIRLERADWCAVDRHAPYKEAWIGGDGEGFIGVIGYGEDPRWRYANGASCYIAAGADGDRDVMADRVYFAHPPQLHRHAGEDGVGVGAAGGDNEIGRLDSRRGRGEFDIDDTSGVCSKGEVIGTGCTGDGELAGRIVAQG